MKISLQHKCNWPNCRLSPRSSRSKQKPYHLKPKKTNKEKKENIQDEPIQKENFIPDTAEKPYSYYLKEASLDELLAYMSQRHTRNVLSYHQYTMLKRRKKLLTKEKLFNEGSLEELISAYKINKDPKYKKRILTLMKNTQENQ